MHDEIYADGVGEITVTGSIVRINLMSLSVSERDEHNNPKAAFRQRIIMPVDAFANTVELMQQAFAGLVNSGAIRRVNDVAVMPIKPIPPAGGELGKPASPPNVSPNFN